MPKRQSKKTNSSPSKEIPVPQQPAIVRIVKQNIPATSTNSPEPSESSSTAAKRENHPIEPELQVNSNQSQSIEVESSNSSAVSTPDVVPQKMNAALDESSLPLTVETAPVNLSALTATDESKSNCFAQSERDSQQPQLARLIPPYKRFETVTNSQGQTFAVGEEIQASTCNFGEQRALITFLYSAPDGSIWASFYPLTKSHQRQWRRGCCRIEHLKKLDENVSNETIETNLRRI
ncbi:hypothetical protein Cylst_6528 (plasmid) [Cylindrospermum stagnale PCC 7417]|uniref:Uncharacterized protein n=1 Tax=Cylindrospermum stagnale PCC 7417 TaxID=56107 RepID=K9X9G7_9NOST|nr:hypothetical protein [Cylindrospermum stagnale]AFZ28307.1 hypothetical protein Cylst_6528 [Cylindrospermum stagnale PCC 7417]